MRRFRTTAVTGAEPITLAEAKAHLRVTTSVDDAYITELISASRQLIERLTRRALPVQTIELTLDYFPNTNMPWWDGVRDGALASFQSRNLLVPCPPAITLTTLTTYDLDNTGYLYDSALYYLDNSDPDQEARLCLNQGAFWPVNLRRNNAVVLVYEAGYDTAPFWLRQATRMMVAYAYANRGDCSEGSCGACGAMSIVRPYIIPSIASPTSINPDRLNAGGAWDGR